MFLATLELPEFNVQVVVDLTPEQAEGVRKLIREVNELHSPAKMELTDTSGVKND